MTTDPGDRLLHARGQSLPDWIALRSGELELFPDGVAYPRDARQIRDLLEFSCQNSIRLIPGSLSSVKSVFSRVSHLFLCFYGVSILLTLDLNPGSCGTLNQGW